MYYQSFSRGELERRRRENVQYVRKMITGKFHKGQIRIFQHGRGPESMEVLGDITGFSIEGNICTVWVDNFRRGFRDNHGLGPWRYLPRTKIVLDLSRAGRVEYNGYLSFNYWDESDLDLGYGHVAFFPSDRLYVRR